MYETDLIVLMMNRLWRTVPRRVSPQAPLARLIKTTISVTETSWTYDLLNRRVTETQHHAEV